MQHDKCPEVTRKLLTSQLTLIDKDDVASLRVGGNGGSDGCERVRVEGCLLALHELGEILTRKSTVFLNNKKSIYDLVRSLKVQTLVRLSAIISKATVTQQVKR